MLNISGVNTATVFVGTSFYNPVSTISIVPSDRIGSKTANYPSAANAQYLFNTSLGGTPLHSGVSLGVVANSKIYTWDGSTSYGFANLSTSNATTTLANGLTFITPFSSYPISTVAVLLTVNPPVMFTSPFPPAAFKLMSLLLMMVVTPVPVVVVDGAAPAPPPIQIVMPKEAHAGIATHESQQYAVGETRRP